MKEEIERRKEVKKGKIEKERKTGVGRERERCASNVEESEEIARIEKERERQGT